LKIAGFIFAMLMAASAVATAYEEKVEASLSALGKPIQPVMFINE
tara:strand:- start:175 stop:309 length:135 start_codon:yes stop_codon:yes gene_type:complete